MELFVVLDTMGDGRLVGAFTQEIHARRVIGEFTHYYHLIPVEPFDAFGKGATVHVVLEDQGALEVHCVFRTRGAADRVAAASSYRRVESVPIDRINPVVLDWAVNDQQRAWLQALLAEQDRSAS